MEKQFFLLSLFSKVRCYPIDLDRDEHHSRGDKETGSREDEKAGFLSLSLELSRDFVSQMYKGFCLFVCLVFFGVEEMQELQMCSYNTKVWRNYKVP